MHDLHVRLGERCMTIISLVLSHQRAFVRCFRVLNLHVLCSAYVELYCTCVVLHTLYKLYYTPLHVDFIARALRQYRKLVQLMRLMWIFHV